MRITQATKIQRRRMVTPKKNIYVSKEDQKILDANPDLVASRLFSQALRRWQRENNSRTLPHRPQTSTKGR